MGADGLHKLRWNRPGMGKLGGARVICFTRLPSGEVVLVAIYAKAKFDNMPVSILKSWLGPRWVCRYARYRTGIRAVPSSPGYRVHRRPSPQHRLHPPR